MNDDNSGCPIFRHSRSVDLGKRPFLMFRSGAAGLVLRFQQDFTYRIPLLHWMMLHHDCLGEELESAGEYFGNVTIWRSKLPLRHTDLPHPATTFWVSFLFHNVSSSAGRTNPWQNADLSKNYRTTNYTCLIYVNAICTSKYSRLINVDKNCPG